MRGLFAANLFFLAVVPFLRKGIVLRNGGVLRKGVFLALVFIKDFINLGEISGGHCLVVHFGDFLVWDDTLSDVEFAILQGILEECDFSLFLFSLSGVRFRALQKTGEHGIDRAYNLDGFHMAVRAA